jgi:hypothetical protein
MLGFMAMDYFRQSPMLAYPLAALAIFMVVFLVVTVRTVLSGKRGYESVALLPLADGKSAQERNQESTKENGRG